MSFFTGLPRIVNDQLTPFATEQDRLSYHREAALADLELRWRRHSLLSFALVLVRKFITRS